MKKVNYNRINRLSVNVVQVENLEMSSNKTNRLSENVVWFRSENVVWGPREEEVPWNKIHYMDLSLHDHSNLEDNVYLEQ